MLQHNMPMTITRNLPNLKFSQKSLEIKHSIGMIRISIYLSASIPVSGKKMNRPTLLIDPIRASL